MPEQDLGKWNVEAKTDVTCVSKHLLDAWQVKWNTAQVNKSEVCMGSERNNNSS